MAAAIQPLDAFVRDALLHGASRESIESVLTHAGWTPEQMRDALGAYAEVDFPVPVPKPRPYLSPREAFLYLVLFSTLYLSAYHVGSLLFEFINRAFPDATDPVYAGGVAQSMRWSVASLLIAFPVFLFVARHLGKDVARNPVKRLSAVRRWLTYLTLFVAATVLIGDLITLVYNLLGGALSTRFVLKALVVGVIAGTIFGYYLRDLRHEEQES